MELSKKDFIALYNSNHHKYCNPRTIKKRFPNIYKDINSLPGQDFRTNLYMYLHDMTKFPVCAACGQPTKFKSSTEGFCTYCCNKCAAGAESTKANRAQTCEQLYGVKNVSAITRDVAQDTMIERYGVSAALKNNSIKQKQEKTMIDRYGVSNPGQNAEIRSKAVNTTISRWGGIWNASEKIKQKTKQTNIERYGTAIPSKSEDVQQKMRETCLERYGVSFVGAVPEIREKIKRTCLERYGVKCVFEDKQRMLEVQNQKNLKFISTNPQIIKYEGRNWICHCPHPECTGCSNKTYITRSMIYRCREKVGAEQCTNLNPIGHNCRDTNVEIFVRNLLKEYNVNFQANVRNIITPHELDIYIPDKHIAIECNGIYWHSDEWKDSLYHLNKKQLCEGSGITLITIWEDQIYRIPQIVESVLLSKLGIYKRRCGARQCTIKEIDSVTCNKFLDCNHIQGRTSSKIKLGAYINDELVGVMTFIQSRGCQGSKVKIDGQWELNRFCTLLNTQVIGLTSKMLKYFINQYHPTSIISFSHNDISVGNVYAKLGFIKSGKSNMSYYYIAPDMTRYHRSSFTRAGIVRRWPEYDINDRSWTEKKVMTERGYHRIYDCGTQKWLLNL